MISSAMVPSSSATPMTTYSSSFEMPLPLYPNWESNSVTALPMTRIRYVRIRPETASALRDMAFVLSLTQRVREEMTNEAARR